MTSDTKDECPRCGLDFSEIKQRLAISASSKGTDTRKKADEAQPPKDEFGDLVAAIDGVLKKSRGMNPYLPHTELPETASPQASDTPQMSPEDFMNASIEELEAPRAALFETVPEVIPDPLAKETATSSASEVNKESSLLDELGMSGTSLGVITEKEVAPQESQQEPPPLMLKPVETIEEQATVLSQDSPIGNSDPAALLEELTAGLNKPIQEVAPELSAEPSLMDSLILDAPSAPDKVHSTQEELPTKDLADDLDLQLSLPPESPKPEETKPPEPAPVGPSLLDSLMLDSPIEAKASGKQEPSLLDSLMLDSPIEAKGSVPPEPSLLDSLILDSPIETEDSEEKEESLLGSLELSPQHATPQEKEPSLLDSLILDSPIEKDEKEEPSFLDSLGLDLKVNPEKPSEAPTEIAEEKVEEGILDLNIAPEVVSPISLDLPQADKSDSQDQEDVSAEVAQAKVEVTATEVASTAVDKTSEVSLDLDLALEPVADASPEEVSNPSSQLEPISEQQETPTPGISLKEEPHGSTPLPKQETESVPHLEPEAITKVDVNLNLTTDPNAEIGIKEETSIQEAPEVVKESEAKLNPELDNQTSITDTSDHMTSQGAESVEHESTPDSPPASMNKAASENKAPSAPRKISEGKSLEELLSEFASDEEDLEVEAVADSALFQASSEAEEEGVDLDSLLSQLQSSGPERKEDQLDVSGGVLEIVSEKKVLVSDEFGDENPDFDALINQLQSTKIEKKKRGGPRTRPLEGRSIKVKAVSLEELSRKFDGTQDIWERCDEALEKNAHLAEDVSFLEMCLHSVDQNVLLMFELAEKEWEQPDPVRRRIKNEPVKKNKPIKIRNKLEDAVAEYEEAEASRQERIQAQEQKEQGEDQDRVQAIGPIWRRMLALIVDLSLTIAGTLFMAWIHILPEETQIRLTYMDNEAILAIAPYLGDLIYTFAILWVILNTFMVAAWGQTPGGKLTKLYTTDDCGFFLSFSHALLRTLCQSVTLLTIGLGSLFILGSSRKTLHDRIAKTMVITQ
jgi:uncharacterized RDD family membrane protein YckC